MTDEKETGLEVSVRAREGVEGALCDYFASDSLSVEELERRLDRTHRATSLEDLRSVLSDLPRGAERFETLIRGGSADSGPSGPRQGGGGPAPGDLQRLEGSRRDNDVALAICGGSARGGRWLPARATTALALCGGVELDFREAVLPPGITEIRILAVMGGVEIIVPPGTAVDARGLAVMGGFDHMDESGAGEPDRPILKIRGLAVMGAIDVDVRHPGESARDARRRRRRERRERRAADRSLPR